MKHIHPFPARMAPEIAIEKVRSLRSGQIVLDPMSGSGLVLSQASRAGIDAIGVDLDPLAELISRVGSRPVDPIEVDNALNLLLTACDSLHVENTRLPWIDDDKETGDFIDFWFAPKQREQLRKIAHVLYHNPIGVPGQIVDVLKVSLSRLIITKEPKASLARDTAHSRPHRTIQSNEFDVFQNLRPSVKHVLSVLRSGAFTGNVSTTLGDARNLSHIHDGAVDLIITSPPYLNAIDYMRGHRLSLVWFGYRMSELRRVRGTAIGAEKSLRPSMNEDFESLLDKLALRDVSGKTVSMLDRFFDDLVRQTAEAFRVLKPNATATYVVGNCMIRGVYVRNSELLKEAAYKAGFVLQNEIERDIPDNRRYMPVTVATGNALAGRMRKEHVIDLKKVA